MPGSPVIITVTIGMGDNIHLGDRNGAHLMQWSPDRNGGFSRVDPAELSHRLLWTRFTGIRPSTSRRNVAINIRFSTGHGGC
jgi:hypothetical protein